LPFEPISCNFVFAKCFCAHCLLKEKWMPQGPEDIAREQIDRMLVSAGWAVQDAKAVNLYAKQGVAIL
jgi:hypothetical protein